MNDFDNVDILLVEDNSSDAEMTMRALRRSNFNHRLFWVKDGVEALDFIHCREAYQTRDAHEAPRVVLLDLKMPRLNGLDVLRELKSHPDTQRIPIVVMTSSNQDRDIAECYRLGANGFVTKPVQVEAFSAAVMQVGAYWITLNHAPGQL